MKKRMQESKTDRRELGEDRNKFQMMTERQRWHN